MQASDDGAPSDQSRLSASALLCSLGYTSLICSAGTSFLLCPLHSTMATPDDTAPRTATIDLPLTASRDVSILLLLADKPIPACVPSLRRATHSLLRADPLPRPQRRLPVRHVPRHLRRPLSTRCPARRDRARRTARHRGRRPQAHDRQLQRRRGPLPERRPARKGRRHAHFWQRCVPLSLAPEHLAYAPELTSDTPCSQPPRRTRTSPGSSSSCRTSRRCRPRMRRSSSSASASGTRSSRARTAARASVAPRGGRSARAGSR